jgi:hypothetical protein
MLCVAAASARPKGSPDASLRLQPTPTPAFTLTVLFQQKLSALRCTLEPKFIELGLVPFGLPKAFAVRLENVGATPACFYFVAPPKLRESQDGAMVWDDSQPLCPPWLLISQQEGEVEQGVCT